MLGGERRATFWVGPLTFLVHLAGVSPGLVGSLVDDAIYVAMGTSLAQDGSLVVPLLPGAPEVAKYPLGFPAVIALLAALGVDLGAESGLWMLLAVNAGFWAIAAQVLVDGLLPKLGAGTSERVAVGLLVAVNTVSLQLVGTAMSEPLFTFCFVSALTLAWGAAEAPSSRGRLAVLALAVAALGATRSVGGPLALVGVGVAFLARQPRVALAVGAGWAAQWLAGAAQRASVSAPTGDALRVLHYFVSYDEHTAFYTRPLLAGDGATFIGRVTGVASRNLELGPRSLAGAFLPADFAGGAAAGTADAVSALGAVAFVVVLAAAVRWPRARPLVALLSAYVAIFILWTWPFSARFWLPIQPLVAACFVLTLARGGNVGRLLMWPVVGLIVVGNAFVPFYRVKGVLGAGGAEKSEADIALDDCTAWLAARARPEDVILGDHLGVWLARQLGTRALDFDALLPSDDHLALTLGLLDPRAEAPRFARELATSFDALDTVLPESATAWVVLASRTTDDLSPTIATLAGSGGLTLAGGFGELSVWQVPRVSPRIGVAPE